MLNDISLTSCLECGNEPKILLVDDNVFNIVTLKSMIELSLGQKCDICYNGSEAVDRFLERLTRPECKCSNLIPPYSLIFMDCNMPIKDGMQATSEIRSLESDYDKGARATIIALTAYSTDSFKEKCLSVGMDDFLTKPIAFDNLKMVVNKCLSIK